MSVQPTNDTDEMSRRVMYVLLHEINLQPQTIEFNKDLANVPTIEEEIPDESSVLTKTIPAPAPNSGINICPGFCQTSGRKTNVPRFWLHSHRPHIFCNSSFC